MIYNGFKETNKGDNMKNAYVTKQKLELEYLKAQADWIDQKIDIYNDQFGPTSDIVSKLKDEVRKVNDLILNLMVREQEESVKRASH
jgi:hypothetical protein